MKYLYLVAWHTIFAIIIFIERLDIFMQEQGTSYSALENHLCVDVVQGDPLNEYIFGPAISFAEKLWVSVKLTIALANSYETYS